MTKIKKIPVKSSAKQAKEQIEGQLSDALVALKDALGEKKFRRRIRKATRILTKNLKSLNSTEDMAAAKKKISKEKEGLA